MSDLQSVSSQVSSNPQVKVVKPADSNKSSQPKKSRQPKGGTSSDLD